MVAVSQRTQAAPPAAGPVSPGSWRPDAPLDRDDRLLLSEIQSLAARAVSRRQAVLRQM